MHPLPHPARQPRGFVEGCRLNAVILAGGRGTRLRPLTDSIPKPMIEFHGKPFLEYLIEMVRDQGIDRFLLLLGYLPEVVQDYFGDGRKWGVSIEYSVAADEDETGRRLKLAQSRIDPTFLLMYCDNYWPLQLDSMRRQFAGGDAEAMVTVYRNDDGYTRDLARVQEMMSTDDLTGQYMKQWQGNPSD